jgi:hypothetical protein
MNAAFYPEPARQAIVRRPLKGRLILAFLRALVGAFKADGEVSLRIPLVSMAYRDVTDLTGGAGAMPIHGRRYFDTVWAGGGC